MDVQIDVQKVLELTRIKLHEANDQNLLLHALVEQQQQEIEKLKTAVDKFADIGEKGEADGS